MATDYKPSALSAVKRHFFGITVAVICSFLAPQAGGHIKSFEGNIMPESDVSPWVRYGTLGCQRFVETGVFRQLLSQECCPSGFGQSDGYRRNAGEFTGSAGFFVTWRETTDVPRAYMNASPNDFSVWSSTRHANWLFTVTADQVEFLHDNPIDLVLDVDIQAGVFHTYYLAIRSDLTYSLYIDGVAISSGQSPDAFPDANASVDWFARYYNQPQNAKWEYVRYGVIPAEHSGDFTNDGLINETDLYYFVDCLLAPDYDAAGPGCRWADMNSDGKADGTDIQLFINAMMGG